MRLSPCRPLPADPRQVAPHPRARRLRAALTLLALGASILAVGATAPSASSATAATGATGTTWYQRAHFVNAASRAFGVGNASEARMATWAELLGRGWSRLAVAEDITNDNWWRGTLVDDAYVAVLGRHPSAASSIARVKTLAAGGTRADLYVSLYSSSEFFWTTSSGDVPTFLGKLYQGVLSHPPNSAAVAAWSRRLKDGMPRATVVDTIVRSAEARGVRVDADYATFLHRQPSPTIRLRRVADLAVLDELVLQKTLAISTEFFTKAQTEALPTGTAPPPAPPSTPGGTALALAESQLGVTYVWGGEKVGVGFDCSGLVQWAWRRAGVSLPRTTYQQVNAPTRVALSKIRPGDLVFYWDTEHVAMYVGNGLVIHAPHTGDVVRYGSLNMGTPEHVVHPG